MIILNIIVVVFLLFALVPAAGLPLRHYAPTEYKSLGWTVVFGFLTTLTLLELVGIPVELSVNYNGYLVFEIIFGILLLAMAVWGILLFRKDKREKLAAGAKTVKDVKPADGAKAQGLLNRINERYSVEAVVYFCLIILAIAFQLAMVFFKASMDADDFYYNSQALSAQTYRTMYRIDADTGRNIPIDIRHAMALFPMFEAFLSSLSGLHVLILTHKVMPFFLIPLSYFICYLIGKELFPKSREKSLLFVFLLNVWRVFGFVSYFTTETFFLLRTWQGKSVAGNIIFPLIVLVFLKMYAGKKEDDVAEKTYEASNEDTSVSMKSGKNILYILLAMLIWSSGAASSLAVLISVGLTVVLAVLFLIYKRDRKDFLRTLVCTVPGIIYMLVYLLAS